MKTSLVPAFVSPIVSLMQAQASYWFQQDVRNGLLDMLLNDPALADRMRTAEKNVAAGRQTPAAAAAHVLNPLRDRLQS